MYVAATVAIVMASLNVLEYEINPNDQGVNIVKLTETAEYKHNIYLYLFPHEMVESTWIACGFHGLCEVGVEFIGNC